MKKYFVIRNFEKFNKSFSNFLANHQFEEIAKKIEASVDTVKGWYYANKKMMSSKIKYPNSEFLSRLVYNYNLDPEAFRIRRNKRRYFRKKIIFSNKRKRIIPKRIGLRT